MNSDEEQARVTELLCHWGASQGQAETMAKQLIKRADQLAKSKGIGKVEALSQLLELVARGRQGEVHPLDGDASDGGDGPQNSR